MRFHLFNQAIFFGLLMFCGVSLVRADSYYVQNLGTLGGTESQATALNNARQVVGFSFTPGNLASHAALFSGTGSNNIDLGNLGGNTNATSEAYGINDSGLSVGYAVSPSGFIHATLFTGTGSNNVDLVNICGTSGSFARAINNSALIVGQSSDCSGDRATLFSNNGVGDSGLGGIGGGVAGSAYAINASGLIVGYGTRFDAAQRAGLFKGTGNVDLGTLGGFNSDAYGINDAGQIVGDALTTNNIAFHATLFSGSGNNNFDMGTLGGLNSHAYSINKAGEIVGNSSTSTNTINHAFIYKNGIMQDLNGLVLPGSGASNIRLIDTGSRVPGRAINDSGQIAAVGEIAGKTHGLLLTPVLRTIHVALNGNDIIVTFDALAGNTYRLERKLDLTDPSWQSIPGLGDLIINGTGPAQLTHTNGASFGKAFYHIRLL